MCRRPLLPLLALAVLMVNLPSCHGSVTYCYQCTGTTLPSGATTAGLTSLRTLNASKSVGTDYSCARFDTSKDQYKMKCPAGYTYACAKNIKNGETYQRGCANGAGDSCKDVGDITQCLCTTDYCNSAGLTTPALLLLLPTALLAIFYNCY